MHKNHIKDDVDQIIKLYKSLCKTDSPMKAKTCADRIDHYLAMADHPTIYTIRQAAIQAGLKPMVMIFGRAGLHKIDRESIPILATQPKVGQKQI